MAKRKSDIERLQESAGQAAAQQQGAGREGALDQGSALHGYLLGL